LILALQACIPGNLAAHKTPTGTHTTGWPGVVTDERLAIEGTDWNAREAVLLDGPEATLTVDLGAEYELHALVLQGDNDDAYWVEGSLDGDAFHPLWLAGAYSGIGLRTRWTELSSSPARYLRVRATGGDGRYSVAELRAYCQRPEPWPPERITPPWVTWSFEQRLNAARIAVALAASLLLFVGLWWRGRVFDGALALLGVLGFCAFFSWGQFHGSGFVHHYEHYHYFIGAKYFPELGYTRLYDCSAVAEAEDTSYGRVAGRKLRNLTTNELEPSAAALDDPERCKSHFTPERWLAFKDDVRFFRLKLAAISDWDHAQTDHGFNATPWWTVFGHLFARLAGPASDDTVLGLALLDPLLLVLMWGCAVWAFGWRSAALALVFWGTNHPARYFWNGGAYLRMDWLCALIAGFCCAKKERPALAGVLLGWSTLLRVFPGFVVGAIVLKWLWRRLRERTPTIDVASKRLVAAFALTLVAGVAISTVSFGARAWPAFVANSRKHLSTPLTNNMGLKTLIAYDEPTRAIHTRDFSLVDPFHRWKEARRLVFHDRQPFYLVLLLGFCVLLAWATSRHDDATALVLGVGLIAFSAELTCYYYSFMIAYALLWPRARLVGVLAAATALLSSCLVGLYDWDEDLYAAISLVYLLFILLVTLLMGRQRKKA
jgi:hypothetical protein